MSFKTLEHVEKIFQKPPENCIDFVLKSVLFVRNRETTTEKAEIGIEIETETEIETKTPSTQNSQNFTALDEILARSRTTDLTKNLINQVFHPNNDEIFRRHKHQFTHTCINYINSYYNFHDLNSSNCADQVDLAIATVWLASKRSNFRKLERIVLAARNAFRLEKKCDLKFYSLIELDILSSLGFRLDLADDYPQKYILAWKFEAQNRINENNKINEINNQEIQTYETALELANQLTKISPISVNRDSVLIAAGCLHISHCFTFDKFNLTNLPWSEKKILKISNLIYDFLKYSQNSWALASQVQFQINNVSEVSVLNDYVPDKKRSKDLKTAQNEIVRLDENEKNVSINVNSPYSNYSNPTSGFISDSSSQNGFNKPEVLPKSLKTSFPSHQLLKNMKQRDIQNTPHADLICYQNVAMPTYQSTCNSNRFLKGPIGSTSPRPSHFYDFQPINHMNNHNQTSNAYKLPSDTLHGSNLNLYRPHMTSIKIRRESTPIKIIKEVSKPMISKIKKLNKSYQTLHNVTKTPPPVFKPKIRTLHSSGEQNGVNDEDQMMMKRSELSQPSPRQFKNTFESPEKTQSTSGFEDLPVPDCSRNANEIRRSRSRSRSRSLTRRFSREESSRSSRSSRKRDISSHSSASSVSTCSFSSSVNSISNMDFSSVGVNVNVNANPMDRDRDRDSSTSLSTCSSTNLDSHPNEDFFQSRFLAIQGDRAVLKFYSRSVRYKKLPRNEKDLVKMMVNEIKKKRDD